MITRSELETRYKALKAKVEVQKAEKDKFQNALSQIKSAIDGMSEIPTLSQLAAFLSTIKEIVKESV